jgi:hypothetical protein
MIIIDPVTLGDAACTRPSPKWVHDRAGTLVEVPADTLAVTYDPSDLSKAPYALVEPGVDVISPSPGLIYSNVAETEPLWVADTYALGARVRDASHVVWESLVENNTAPLPTETNTYWGKVGATAPWAMFDQYNNTQTTAPEEILVVLSPRAIAQGVYLGNVDASDIRVSVVDPVEGLVYSETKSLISPTPGSSFYNWAFRRIKRANYFLTMKLPPYAAGLVTLAIRKPGRRRQVRHVRGRPGRRVRPVADGAEHRGQGLLEHDVRLQRHQQHEDPPLRQAHERRRLDREHRDRLRAHAPGGAAAAPDRLGRRPVWQHGGIRSLRQLQKCDRVLPSVEDGIAN